MDYCQKDISQYFKVVIMRKIRVNSRLQNNDNISFYELNSDIGVDLEAEGFMPTSFSELYHKNKFKKRRKR